MINADEHKKLLAQIAELEKDSINYFDVEKEFFLIDSENLSQVRPKLYGYSIQRTGIYEDDNLTAEAIAGLNGRGCYIYVEVKDGQITIKQDLNGSWGIYLFRQGDYFALSNSFFRLINHVKFKYPLTVNHDYFYHLFLEYMYAHSETAINEIQSLDRGAIIHINMAKKTLDIESINYKEYSLRLDSKEGIAVLDRWIEFWGDFFRGLAQRTNYISVDLSGGFDSRVAFVPVLCSGIDLNKIRINSKKGTLHTYKEDYSIASKIANHYGFKLNNPFSDMRSLNYSLFDSFNMELYIRYGFTSIPELFLQKFVEKSYYIGGTAGEAIRNYWSGSPKEFISGTQRGDISVSHALISKIFSSIENVLNRTFHDICNKYKIENPNSLDIVRRLYIETRSNKHFGKYMLLCYFANIYRLSPILDTELLSINLEASKCPDPNLMMTLIFTRYAPDLLMFPFDSGRSIAPETIEYAKKINERFPRRVTTDKVDRGGGVLFTAA